MSTSRYETKVRKLVASSTSGTTLLIMVQVASRAFTFGANQLVLRSLSPTILGIATQLELYSISILYFSRESIRVAIQRQPLDLIPAAVGGAVKGSKEKRKIGIEFQSASTQSIVNFSYLSLVFGIPLSLMITAFYIRLVPEEVSQKPFFESSLAITGIASLLELCIEPFFAVVQQHMLYSTRAIVETSAAFIKSVSICAMSVWATYMGYDVGVLPFALGYLSYSLSLICGYSMTLSTTGRERQFSFLPKRIQSSACSDQEKYIADRFSRRLISVVTSVFFQSVVKHLLTQGDSMMLAALSSLEDQGIYSLASNYGGLIARIIFQPIEESSRNLFSTLLTSSEKDKLDLDCMGAAQAHLADILRAYGLLAMIIFPIGPVFVPLLLRLVVGQQWTSAKVESLLSLYCYYIPFLAFNGISEAFVSAAANPSELRKQAGWMGAFSACFACAAYVFLRVGNLGAQGLVWANIVNMAVRMLWSYFFIKSYFRRHGNELTLADFGLRSYTYVAGITATSVVFAKQGDFATEFSGTFMALTCGIAYALLIIYLEREYLTRQYFKIRNIASARADRRKTE